MILSFLHNRVGGGFWRRGGEAPKAVKWEDRVIQICEGSWSYVIGSSSIGRSPGMFSFFIPLCSFYLLQKLFNDYLKNYHCLSGLLAFMNFRVLVFLLLDPLHGAI